MSHTGSLPWNAPLDAYRDEARALFAALVAGERDAAWRFKWLHPRFRGRKVEEVRTTTLTPEDAKLVVAQEYAFDTWAALEAFTREIASPGAAARFEAAVEAVVSGDVPALRAMRREHPGLVRERSARRHHATLLHYVAANGVEGGRQRTPPSAVEVARVLLEAGAEADALADMYDHRCTTLSMLVSSSHPAEAGLQGALAETLLDHGAALEGPGSEWTSALLTALLFGFLETARALVRRGAPVRDLAAAAGLGLTDQVARSLPASAGPDRHRALALAAQLGHADVVTLLLDTGEDPSRYNPDGFHAHSTPLHQAVWSDHGAVVRLLVERGARLDLRDTIYDGTPLGWALYGGRTAVAEYLRSRGAPE